MSIINVVGGGGLLQQLVEASLPYIVLILSQFLLALFISLQQLVFSDGLNAVVFFVYQQILSAVVLSCSALLFSNHIPRLSLPLLSWAFLLGFIQIAVGGLVMAVSLNYVTATFQSVALNVTPAVVFALAIFTGQESFQFWSVRGAAKIAGILASCAGAIILVFITNSSGSGSDSGLGSGSVPAKGQQWIGCLLVGIGVLCISVGSLLLEKFALKYQADLTLSAIMCVFGTLQTLIIAVSTEREVSSWKIKWSKTSELFTILYGGIVLNGACYFARTWSLRKKGPVFGGAFSPLLIVFSFILQTLFFGASAHLWSVAAALLVVAGLYLLLWAKSTEDAQRRRQFFGSIALDHEPLLENES